MQVNANGHLQDKQIHTASVVRNMHFKEAECGGKKIVFDFVISSDVNMQWEHETLACFHLFFLH